MRSSIVALPPRIPLLLIAWALSAIIAMAQDDAILTQYWAVPTYYNPAAAGGSDNIRLRGGMRAQWVGIDNAPRSFLATADSPFKLFGRRWGAGITVRHESCGLVRGIAADLQLGYKFKAAGGDLSIALQAGLFNEQFKGSQLCLTDDDDHHQPDDVDLPNRDVTGNAIDLGVGAYYSRKHFSAGLSLMHANTPSVTFRDNTGYTPSYGDASADPRNKNYRLEASPTLYFTAEGNIPVKNTLFEVLPSVLIGSDFTDTDLVATLRARYKRIFSAGIGYRYNDAVSLLLGVELKGIFIGYSYDHHISGIAKASSGSHEVFAGYNLRLDFSEKNRHKHKSIRIM